MLDKKKKQFSRKSNSKFTYTIQDSHFTISDAARRAGYEHVHNLHMANEINLERDVTART